MSESTAKLRAFLLSVLMVTSVVAGTVAITGTAGAAVQNNQLGNGIDADNTDTHTVDSGTPAMYGGTYEVADVSYNASAAPAEGWNVSSVQVGFRGDQSFLEDDTDGDGFNDAVADVAMVRVTLYKGDTVVGGTGSTPGSGTGSSPQFVPYTATGQSYNVTPFNGNITNITRVTIEAMLASEIYAEHSDVLDTRYNLSDNAGTLSATYDTDGRTVIHSKGEGEIVGEVNNASSNGGLEDATVWAFGADRAFRNALAYNLGGVSSANDGELFVRVIDEETGLPVDNDDYIVTPTDDVDISVQEDGEKVTKVEQLNGSDRSVGSGFVAFDRDGDNNVQFTVIPLEAGQYRIETSENQMNASRFATPTTTGFSNASGTNWTATTGVSLQVNENLTSDAAAARDDLSGADLYQEVTDAEGNFVLSDLFGDGADGEFYWVAAEKEGFGFDRDFRFVEDTRYKGVKDNDPVHLDSPLVLNEEPTATDYVDIRKNGTYDDVSSAVNDTGFTPFADKNDSAVEEVPRDGSTVVQYNVETRIAAGGQFQNGTVTLHVPDNETFGPAGNLGGNWLNESAAVVGGSVVSVDDANESMTITTGNDGNATVHFLVDQSEVNLDLVNESYEFVNTSGAYAELTFDPLENDNTTVRYVGIIQPAAASLSGIVTNDVEQPIEGAVVWNDRVDFLGGLSLTAEPNVKDGTAPDNFTLTLIDRSTGAVVNTATVDASLLQVGGPGYDFSDFPRISTDEDETFTLWTFSRAPPTTGAYTLPNVPASNDTVNPTTYALQGAFDAGENSLRGRATDITTAANATGTGNVVLLGAEQSNFAISGVSAPANATAGDTISVSATISNLGGLSDTQDVVVMQNGSQVAVLESDLTLDPGTSAEVSGDVPVPEDANGTVTFEIVTEDNVESFEVDVSSDCELSEDVEAYAGEDCSVSTSELNQAITDWAQEEIDTGTLTDVINAWAAS